MRNLLIHVLAAMLNLDAQVFHYQPHDVILFHTRARVTLAQVEACRDELKRCFTSDVSVVLLTSDFEWPIRYPVQEFSKSELGGQCD